MLDSFEYTFFDKNIAEKFAAYIEAMGHEFSIYETDDTGEQTYEVAIGGTLNDSDAEKLENFYSDMLFGEQAAQVEGNEAGAIADVCGVQVVLANGEFTNIAIEPEMMNKILSVLTVTELQTFLAQVVEDVENPKSGPICRRMDKNI